MKTRPQQPQPSRNSLPVACVLSVVLTWLGCGGGTSSPPPSPDFSFSVAPSSLTVTVGTVSPAISVAVSAKNGFADTINVSIEGLPSGAISAPQAPLAMPPNGSQSVTLFIPPSTPDGPLSIEFEATGGARSHTAIVAFTLAPVSNTATLQETSGPVPVGTMEIQGLSAGAFKSAYWQRNTLNWVPDVREPMFTALTTSLYQNIYAPWPLEQPAGWRLFYGGWDGSDTPNDRVYSVATTDFLTFDNRQLVIDHGAFQHVNNVNVHQLPDGSLHMACTGGAYDGITNWPTYFSSPDGVTWNGSAEPYQAQTSDIIGIQGYSDYQYGGFNGGNVLFWDNSWTLYFYDNFNNGHIYRAGASARRVQLQGIVLATGADPNGVYKFMEGSEPRYLMTLMSNGPQLWYSLSNDGLAFGPMNNLFGSISSLDTAMDSLGFVTKGNQLLGTVYRANSGSPETQFTDNSIFARWLQKRVVITDSSGVQYFAQGAYGPDRQWFQVPTSGTLEGTMVVYAEDGLTPLGSSLVSLTGSKSYRLSLR